nr:MAG TPA: hypothetical protein [Caudoviricetes sp.]
MIEIKDNFCSLITVSSHREIFTLNCFNSKFSGGSFYLHRG